MTELIECKQKSDESIADYSHAICKLVHGAFGETLPEHSMWKYFIHALTAYKGPILQGNPMTFDAALTLAKMYESQHALLPPVKSAEKSKNVKSVSAVHSLPMSTDANVA